MKLLSESGKISRKRDAFRQENELGCVLFLFSFFAENLAKNACILERLLYNKDERTAHCKTCCKKLNHGGAIMGILILVAAAAGLMVLLHDHDRYLMSREAMGAYKHMEYHRVYPTSN